MKAKILIILLLGVSLSGITQTPVQRPDYGFRNEVDTSRHLINGFGITTLDFNGTANAVIQADTGAIATQYDISFKINKADSTGNAAGNYVTHTQQTTALALKINQADSTGNAPGNYVTHTYASANYSTKASPTFTGTASIPTLVLTTTDTTGTPALGAIVFRAADSSFYGCRSTTASHKWYKINP